jgi:hypothetical protein
MDHSLLLKDDVRNALRAAERVASELGRRGSNSPQKDVFLDGFTMALDLISTSLGVEVFADPPVSREPREWREVWDALPAVTFGEEAPLSQ